MQFHLSWNTLDGEGFVRLDHLLQHWIAKEAVRDVIVERDLVAGYLGDLELI